MTDDGGLDIIGIGLADSKGIRRGVVVNLEAAVESIKKAIDEAELTAGVEIDSVHLGLSGAHVKAFNSRGVVAVAGKNREITREDVRRAIDAAKAVALPSGREILHVLPQDFVVDEQDGIGAPVGMTGARLEVNVHIVTGSASLDAEHRRLRQPRRRRRRRDRARAAGGERVGADRRTKRSSASRSSTSAAARPTSPSSSAAACGTPASIAVGGDHFTNDIAVGLRTPIPDAEKIKRRVRLRAVGDGRRGRDHGGGERRRPQAAGDGAADSVGDPPAARRGGLPPAVGRDPASRASRSR